MSRRFLAVLLTLAVCAVACAGDEDTGDPAAFCAMVENRVGFDAGGSFDQAGLERLIEVAPPEVRDAVKRLANTARSLEEIPNTDLAELFDAAFDPQAQEARMAFEAYAVGSCGVDEQRFDNDRVQVGSAADVVVDVEGYLSTYFERAPWVSDLRIGAGLDPEGGVASVTARFSVEPEDAEQVNQVCQALSLYLYEVVGSAGRIDVGSPGGFAVVRTGPEASCDVP